MTYKPDKAFILAAGFGTRLRPYTETIPKPMVDVAGKSIIKRTLEKLEKENVREVVVNLHHLSDVLEAHLKDVQSPSIVLSKETEILETGGGLKKAIHYFGNEPFYIINGDALWDDGRNGSVLSCLSNYWDDEAMDILILLHPVEEGGDYQLSGDVKPVRSKNKTGNYMFAGIRIAHPRIFENTPDGAFSFLALMDRAEEQGRLYGLVHEGAWYHISTPEDLAAVNETFRSREER